MATTLTKIWNNKYFIISRISLFASLPVVLLALPKDFFDTGKSICLSRLLLDAECPGCGITRAMMHIIHFDFHSALLFNKLSFIVLPLLIYEYIKQIRRDIKSLRKYKKDNSNIE